LLGLGRQIQPARRPGADVDQRRHQQRALEQLRGTRRRAEVQIERAATMLGTIYSQLLTRRSSGSTQEKG
jgi:hypothetical protein